MFNGPRLNRQQGSEEVPAVTNGQHVISEKKASRLEGHSLVIDRPRKGPFPPPPARTPHRSRVRSRGADLKRTHLVSETTPSDRQHRPVENLSKETVQKGHCVRAPHLYFVRVFRTMPEHLRGCRIH